MKKLILCAGHYYGTEGRRCLKKYDPNETREWVLNDRVADRVEKLLKDYDVEILRVDDTTGQKYISLSDRTKKGNEWGADFWCGIHHNAGVNGGKGGGITVYVYTKPDSVSLEWQKLIYDKLMKYSPELKGNRATPLAKANLAECRDTKMPSVLLELGFMDSSTDIPLIITDEHADKCAKAIAEAIIEKMNLKKTTVDVGKYMYYIQLAACTKSANAKKVQKDLQKKGYYTFIVQEDGYYKVRSGAYALKSDAESSLAEYKAEGYKDAFIVQVAII